MYTAGQTSSWYRQRLCLCVTLLLWIEDQDPGERGEGVEHEHGPFHLRDRESLDTMKDSWADLLHGDCAPARCSMRKANYVGLRHVAMVPIHGANHYFSESRPGTSIAAWQSDDGRISHELTGSQIAVLHYHGAF